MWPGESKMLTPHEFHNFLQIFHRIHGQHLWKRMNTYFDSYIEFDDANIVKTLHCKTLNSD